MKIALVNTLYAPYQVGGAERAVQILAEGLSQRGHSVCVITLGEADLDCCSVINGVTVYRLPLENWYWPYSGSPGNAAERAAWHMRDFHNAAMSARVGSVLDQERPDILHTNSLAGFSVGIWSQATQRRVPIVHTLHDYYLMCPPSAMYRNAANCERICPRCLPFAAYRRRASRAVQAVVGVSRYILDRHIHGGFFKDSRTAKVIFNSIPFAQGKAPKSRKGLLAFGFIGRICVEKGVRWLLEVFTENAHPGGTLVVAGKGERGFVESLKAKFSSRSVTWIGHVDPAVFYAQVDVVVIPSLWNEPFGRTAIESLAHGIPVIASNRGGLPEIIEDGVTGMIIDPHEPGSLARAMSRFSAEPELAGRLGRNGAQRLSPFSEDSAIDTYGSLYADVMSCRERGPACPKGTRSTSVVRAK
jgi:glycosyltransferase involved in cell wall biosynthesis